MLLEIIKFNIIMDVVKISLDFDKNSEKVLPLSCICHSSVFTGTIPWLEVLDRRSLDNS